MYILFEKLFHRQCLMNNFEYLFLLLHILTFKNIKSILASVTQLVGLVQYTKMFPIPFLVRTYVRVSGSILVGACKKQPMIPSHISVSPSNSSLSKKQFLKIFFKLLNYCTL